MTNGSLMKVESISECSAWSILQYFWPALNDNWSWKPIFDYFESGRFTQFLLYRKRLKQCDKINIFSLSYRVDNHKIYYFFSFKGQ